MPYLQYQQATDRTSNIGHRIFKRFKFIRSLQKAPQGLIFLYPEIDYSDPYHSTITSRKAHRARYPYYPIYKDLSKAYRVTIRPRCHRLAPYSDSVDMAS